jgi:hypothetical protein
MADTPEDRSASENGPGQEKRYWLDDIRNVHKIFWALVIVCALLFVSDAFVVRKSKFFFEEWFGFFGLFGFGLSFLLVLTSKELRKILKRGEDYYDR